MLDQHHDPPRVRAQPDQLDIARRRCLDRLQIGREAWVHGLPAPSIDHRPARERSPGDAVKEGSREIGVAVLGQHPRPTRRHVHGDERRLVAVPRVEEVQGLAVVTEIQEPRGFDLAARDRDEGHPRPAGPALEHFDTAVSEVPGAEPQLKRAVGHEPGELVVLVHEHGLPGHQVDTVEVEELLVAFVVREDHLAGEALADLVHPGTHPARRRERHDGAVADVDARGAPVLVAVALLEVDDVAIRVRPQEDVADRTIGRAREGPGGAEIADRCNPQVSHAVDRRDVRDRGAVERELGPGDVGIAEEGLARDQRASEFSSRPCGPRQEQSRGDRGGACKKVPARRRDRAHRDLPSPDSKNLAHLAHRRVLEPRAGPRGYQYNQKPAVKAANRQLMRERS